MFHGGRREDMPPHIFAVAQQAYTSLLTDHTDQAIVLLGPSGAGKTFNARYLLRYLATVGSHGVDTHAICELTVCTCVCVCVYVCVCVCVLCVYCVDVWMCPMEVCLCVWVGGCVLHMHIYCTPYAKYFSTHDPSFSVIQVPCILATKHLMLTYLNHSPGCNGLY